MKTGAFFDRHPVFSLEQAGRAFGQEDRRATMERLRYHVSTGRLKGPWPASSIIRSSTTARTASPA